MEIKIDLKESELGSLYTTATQSFIHDQPDRFVPYGDSFTIDQVIEAWEKNDNLGTMVWFEDFLNMKIFEAGQKAFGKQCFVMYDESDYDYCAWIETDFQSFLKTPDEEEDNSALGNDNNIVLVAGENTTELMMDLAKSSIAHLNPLSTVTINEELIAADIPERAVQVIYPDDTVEIFEGEGQKAIADALQIDKEAVIVECTEKVPDGSYQVEAVGYPFISEKKVKVSKGKINRKQMTEAAAELLYKSGYWGRFIELTQFDEGRLHIFIGS